MKAPRLTVAMTVNNRSHDTLNRVFDSLRAQDYDRLIVVADGVEPETREALDALMPTMMRADRLDIARPRGWLCPARAWNEAFARVDTELTMMISSETVQADDNVAVAKDMLAGKRAVVFGSARCSIDGCPEVNWGDDTASHIFCDAAHPRPLGFVVAMQTSIIRAAGGFDEGFMGGYWYDDDDFFFRVWRVGVPFIFTDKMSGVHIHHERASLSADGIARNRAYIMSKYGLERPLSSKAVGHEVKETREPGLTVWSHRCLRCGISNGGA